MNTCLMCGSPSGRCKFCKKCGREKNKASALVSQNSKKLSNLLKTERLNVEGFEKFMIYTDNIIKNGKSLISFKSCDNLRRLVVISGYENK